MPNLQQLEQPKDNEPQKRDALQNQIKKQVLAALGTPLDLLKVQVGLIGDDRYRVNVLVGSNVGAKVKVANSFFIVSDSNGRGISASPAITKQY